MSDYLKRFEAAEAELQQAAREALVTTRQLLRRSRWAKRRRVVIKCLCAALWFMLVLEGLLRLLPHYATNAYEVDGRYGWALLPNKTYQAADYDTREVYQYTTNSRGWKDVEHTYAKPPGVTRILFVGDSNTIGVVPMGQEYHRQLEQLLHEAGYTNVEVIAIGIGAWGTDQELMALTDEGLRYEPDIVVYQLDANDFTDILPASAFPADSIQAAQPFYYSLDEGVLTFHTATPFYTPAPLPLKDWLAKHSRLFEYTYRYTIPVSPLVVPAYDARTDRTADSLPLWAALVRQMQATSTPAYFAVWSQEDAMKAIWFNWSEADRQQWHATLADSIAPIPLWVPTRGYRRYKYDQHANASGNLAMAEDLMDYLIAAGWLNGSQD